MKRSYMVVFERIADDNWGGWVPDISGAVGAGDSREDAYRSLVEAIGFQLEDLHRRGIESPAAVSRGVNFSDDADPTLSHYEIEWVSVDLPQPGSHSEHSSRQAA